MLHLQRFLSESKAHQLALASESFFELFRHSADGLYKLVLQKECEKWVGSTLSELLDSRRSQSGDRFNAGRSGLCRYTESLAYHRLVLRRY
jgi:hypothetical protein